MNLRNHIGEFVRRTKALEYKPGTFDYSFMNSNIKILEVTSNKIFYTRKQDGSGVYDTGIEWNDGNWKIADKTIKEPSWAIDVAKSRLMQMYNKLDKEYQKLNDKLIFLVEGMEETKTRLMEMEEEQDMMKLEKLRIEEQTIALETAIEIMEEKQNKQNIKKEQMDNLFDEN